jgi:hypothetical protein
MTKNLFFLMGFIIAPFIAFAQTDITVGPPYRVIDAGLKEYFYNENEILTIKIDGKRIFIQKLNAETLKFIKETEYEDMPDHSVLLDLTEFNNRYYLFYSLWDKPNQIEQLFAREIDFARGTFTGTDRNLLNVNAKMGSSFGFNTSHDKSKMLIQYRLKPESRNDDKNYDVIGLHVLDKDLINVWNKEIRMPYTEKKMNNIDYSVDSKGNAYILTTVYNDNTTNVKKKDNNEQANYHIELLRIKANTNTALITPVSVNDKFINKLWLYESPGDYMICAGYYNNGKNFNAVDGVILFKVSQEGNVYDMATYEIPLEVLNQYVSPRKQKKNKKAEEKDKAQFEELELMELIIDKEGNILMIGEQYYITSHTSTSSSDRTTTYYLYHYDDLLITKIDAAGKLAWMKKIPKYQVGGSMKGGMSYKYISYGDDHYFLFLDNEKNQNLPLDQSPARHSDGAGGIFTAYKINDSHGEMSMFPIFDTRNVNGIPIYQFTTSRIRPLSPGKFVVEAYKKKKEDVLIKVTLK